MNVQPIRKRLLTDCSQIVHRLFKIQEYSEYSRISQIAQITDCSKYKNTVNGQEVLRLLKLQIVQSTRIQWIFRDFSDCSNYRLLKIQTYSECSDYLEYKNTVFLYRIQNFYSEFLYRVSIQNFYSEFLLRISIKLICNQELRL